MSVSVKAQATTYPAVLHPGGRVFRSGSLILCKMFFSLSAVLLTLDHYVQVDLLFCIILRTARLPDTPFNEQRIHKKSNSDVII